MKLAGRLIDAQEKERALIAREIHDDILQSLTILELKLAAFEQGKIRSKDTRSHLRDSRRLVRKVASDLRGLSHRVHPATLEFLGLAAAIKDQCREINEHNRVKVVCEVGDVPLKLNTEIATCLYRVFQEGLRNILKHSCANQSNVSLNANSRRISLIVSDDGIGFEPNATNASGLGLVSMKERLHLLGGKFKLVSALGEGTQIEASIPLLGGSPSLQARISTSRQTLP